MRDHRYWFKKNGWLHWTPISWEGWLATVVFAGVVGVDVSLLNMELLPRWMGLSWALVCVAALLYLIAKTTDPQA